MSFSIINFKNNQGDVLVASLSLPADEKPHAYALFAHCFFSSLEETTVVNSIVRELNQKGIAVFSLDITGFSQQNPGYAASIEDILSASDYMAENLKSPQLLIGHSLAGSAAILLANRIASVDAIVTISAFSKVKSIEKVADVEGDYANVHLLAKEFKVKSSFINQISSPNYADIIHKIKLPLLIFHSPFDAVVDIKNAEKIYKNAFHPKSFISLDDANHFLSTPRNGQYVGNMIGSWAERYVEMELEDPLETQYQTAVRIGTTKYVTEVKAGVHHQIADEPLKDGGKDLGPNPYQFLLAGLGACTAMTLRMYANHKKWNLEEVTVHLNHENEYLKDAENANKRTAKIDNLYRHIQIKGDLTEKQRGRLLEIANKCPVHRTLENNPVIHTDLLD
ncbi:osmotically inducible protein C [Flammeovirga pectinis]|uniref:Osmotically inducible protein C n=1 Tax=Flammeovirga pectinis TaxID=2494373 RepID=A0A3Q9FP00_9BACT|nr:bifunctional alpha/beta hydrolase/OsmC family protein [Flammeovirga pectinis]AZQ61494.1 osmotically inducible protein C [Flammeovirga pectinis]